MIAQDDPRHIEQRKLVSRRFTPKAVRDHEPWLRSTIGSLIDAMVLRFRTARPVSKSSTPSRLNCPCRLTASLLGWEESRWPDIKSWSERLMRYDAIPNDPEAMMGMMQAIMEFNPELQTMTAERRGLSRSNTTVT